MGIVGRLNGRSGRRGGPAAGATGPGRLGWMLLPWLVGVVWLCSACGDPPREKKRSGDPDDDAIMLSDNVRLGRDGSGWSAGAAGVTANVIQAHDDTLARFEVEADGLGVFQGMEVWRSNEGPPSLTLRSSLQNAVATFDGTSYGFTGLAAGPAFAESDTLTVEDGATSMTVEAPPPLADPTALLGDPVGLSTPARIPDGTFDLFYVFVLGDDGAPGQDGLMRSIPADSMPLEGGMRVAPLLDDAAVTALESRGITVTAVYVAYYNVEESTAFFPGRGVPVQAGRMFQIDPSDLVP